MGLFKKKQSRDELIAQGIADSEAAAASTDTKDNDVHTGNEKVDLELTKIKAQLESFGEIRKANQERFSRISEQTGELRGMIIDTNKAMSKIEVAATKAVDLVESVHPEKLMVEVRKQDGKIAAQRAMIESNDSIMKDIMAEMKRMRGQMNFYKGTEQVLKMNEEVKKELANIKKMEAVVERHADRVETIFVEVEKKFSNFDKYDTTVKEIKEGFRKMTTDFEKVRAQLVQKEDKKEFVDLLDKFNDFEKHTTNLLQLLDDRSKVTKKEIEADFKKLKNDLVVEIEEAKKKPVNKEKTTKEIVEEETKNEPETTPEEQQEESRKQEEPEEDQPTKKEAPPVEPDPKLAGFDQEKNTKETDDKPTKKKKGILGIFKKS